MLKSFMLDLLDLRFDVSAGILPRGGLLHDLFQSFRLIDDEDKIANGQWNFSDVSLCQWQEQCI